MAKKKRTKRKKQVVSSSKIQAKRKEEAVKEVTETKEVAEEIVVKEENEKEETLVQSAPKKSPRTEERAAMRTQTFREQLEKGRALIENGNNKEARKVLTGIVSNSEVPLEELEEAQALLDRIEMDVRTLLVGAIAMLGIVLIPVVGFVKALWVLPLLFPVLLPLVPGLIAMVAFWTIPFIMPLKMSFYFKILIPVIGLLIALLFLIIRKAPEVSERS